MLAGQLAAQRLGLFVRFARAPGYPHPVECVALHQAHLGRQLGNVPRNAEYQAHHGVVRGARVKADGDGRVDKVIARREQGRQGAAQLRVVPEDIAHAVLGEHVFNRRQVLKVVRERDEVLPGQVRGGAHACKRNLDIGRHGPPAAPQHVGDDQPAELLDCRDERDGGRAAVVPAVRADQPLDGEKVGQDRAEVLAGQGRSYADDAVAGQQAGAAALCYKACRRRLARPRQVPSGPRPPHAEPRRGGKAGRSLPHAGAKKGAHARAGAWPRGSSGCTACPRGPSCTFPPRTGSRRGSPPRARPDARTP